MLPPTALFIVEKITEQARRENIASSDVECKMLLFSEKSPTFPNIEALNEMFDRDYDRLDYEAKIRSVRSTQSKDSQENQAWDEAVNSLRGEDYYVLVMLKEVGHDKRSRGDLLRLISTALLIVAALLGVAFFFSR